MTEVKGLEVGRVAWINPGGPNLLKVDEEVRDSEIDVAMEEEWEGKGTHQERWAASRIWKRQGFFPSPANTLILACETCFGPLTYKTIR